MAKKILIISPVPLFPGHAGNRERIRAICVELMSRGYLLDFFYTGFHQEVAEAHKSFFNGTVLKHALSREKVQWNRHPIYRAGEVLHGFKTTTDRWYRHFKEGPDSARFNKSLSEYKNFGKQILLEKQTTPASYQAVIVNYAPYSFYFDFFDKRTIKIIDTHDRLTDRFKLFSDNSQDPINWHSLYREDEKRALAKADIVWAITDEEKEYFKKILRQTEIRIYTLRHLLPFEPTENRETFNTIVMIGSANRLNIDGLTWFLEQVWRKLTHYNFNLRFVIAGSICEVVDESILDEQVELYGRFNSLQEIYSKGDLFINPMQEGTGLKIKTFEALANGKTVLSTEAGATGLHELIGNGLICSNDPAVWIREIKKFFEDGQKKKKDLKNADKIITQIYQENLGVIGKSLDIKKEI